MPISVQSTADKYIHTHTRIQTNANESDALYNNMTAIVWYMFVAITKFRNTTQREVCFSFHRAKQNMNVKAKVIK